MKGNLKQIFIILLILMSVFLLIGSVSASDNVTDDDYSNETLIDETIESELNSSDLEVTDDLNNETGFDESSKLVYESTEVQYSSLTKDYTKGNIVYQVSLYDILSNGGEKFKDPKYGSIIKLRVYTDKNYKDYKATIGNDGIASIKIGNLAIGNHNVEIYADINKMGTSSIKVIKSSTKVYAPSKNVKYKKSTNFKIKVFDSAGITVKNVNIKIKVYTGKKYKIYTVKTNSYGNAYLNTKKLSLGSHKIVIYSNSKLYKINKTSKINVKRTISKTPVKLSVTAPTKTLQYQKTGYYNITVKDSYNVGVKDLTLKVKVYTGKSYKTYSIKTNSKGIAKLNVKTFSLGTHKIMIGTNNKNYLVDKTSKIIIDTEVVSDNVEPTCLISLQYYIKDGDYYAKLCSVSKKGSDYQILRKTNDSYGVIATVTADSEKITFYDNVDGVNFYTYSIRQIIENGNNEKVLGPYDKDGLTLIDNVDVSVDFQNLKAEITWSQIDDATKYRVFRKMGKEGQYACIAVVDASQLNYTDIYYKSSSELAVILNSGIYADPSFNNLFYTVRACKVGSFNGIAKASYGLYLVDGDFNLETPTIVSINGTYLRWGKVPNAEGYLILKKNGTDDEWEIIGNASSKTSTTLTYDLGNVDNNSYYSVQAFALKNGEIVYSSFDKSFSLINYSTDNAKYRLLYIGDSITYGSPYKSESSRHIFSFPYRVSQLLGCVYYNPSIPGSTYHDLGQINGLNILTGDYYRYRIARELVDPIFIGELPGNWEDLDNSRNSEGQMNTTMDEYNIVILSAGTNDYRDNTELGSEDSDDDFTFNGALNHIISKIELSSKLRVERGEEAIKVIFVDLFYSDRTFNIKERNNRDITPNTIGLTLMDYQDALNKQYDKWSNSSEYLSFYNFKTRDYGIVDENNAPYTASDNLHYTKYTYSQYGNAFAQFLFECVFADKA